MLDGYPLQLQGLEAEADFLSGQCPSQVTGAFKRNIYSIYLSKGANSVFRPIGTVTRSVPDMTICLPQWTASKVEIQWGRKKETISNSEKDMQRMVEGGKDIAPDRPPEAIRGAPGEVNR